MASHGVTLTKACRVCKTTLHLNENWNISHASTRQYICKACYRKKNAARMRVEKHYVSFKHPLHKPGNYKNFLDCAFNNLVKKERAMEGWVYLLTNPAYPDWVKVGCAIDAEDRCGSYQTSSPFRDYQLIAKAPAEDRVEMEKDLLSFMEGIATDRRGEWFQIPADSAVEAFEYWSDLVCA